MSPTCAFESPAINSHSLASITTSPRILFATYLGLPVSSTHAIAGAIAGVGSIQRTRAVRWHVAGGIVTAWVLTMPASATVAAIVYYGIRLFVPAG
jgi:phosphate/sulfate permease